MGAEGFHGRVRDGIGCLAPRYGHQAGEAPLGVRGEAGGVLRSVWGRVGLPLARTGGLALHAGGGAVLVVDQHRGSSRSERLVPVSCGDCSLSTSGLSTWWSTTALGETWF